MDAFPAAAPPRAVPPLAADEIHVWSLDLDPGAAPRAISAAARATLERLLAGYAGLDAAPAIGVGRFGKPFAPALPGLDFNLSHAGPRVLLAFARGQPLGVDLERIDRRVSLHELAERFYAADEAAALRGVPEPARLRSFLELWTRKEAVLKAIGQGLSFGLDRIAFAVGAGGEVGALRHVDAEAGRAAEWRVVGLDAGAGFVAALAWRGAPRRLLRFAA